MPSVAPNHNMQAERNVNEAGVPTTGREEAVIGVAAARRFVEQRPSTPATPQIFDEFKLKGRTAIVTGGNGGLGLEMVLVLAELGATVYCVDLATEGSQDFFAAKTFAKSFGSKIEYRQADVTDQPLMRSLCQDIADTEGSLDVCIAAAGILHGASCLEYPIEEFQRVMNVNTNGVFITASASAAQMAHLKIPGSIIIIASMSGSITNRDQQVVQSMWLCAYCIVDTKTPSQ